jgi:hypothetical protein
MRPSRFVRQTASPIRWISPADATQHSYISISQNRETWIAHKTTAKITARREKSSEWSALEKPVALLNRLRRSPDICRSLELAKGFEPPTL